MPPDNAGAAPPDPLAETADAYGIEREYWDIWGKPHRASPEAQRAILNSLGVDASTPGSLAQALDERRWREWQRPLPPCIIISAGAQPAEISVALPHERSSARVTVRVRLEDGSAAGFEIDPADAPTTGHATLRGRKFVRKRVRLQGTLPLGYHELAILLDGELSAPSRLIVCPERMYEPDWLREGKAAGLGISLYGVRSGRNWGCGDFTDLKAIVDWSVDRLQASFVALNPLHAIANRQPYNTSPYLPNSIFYKNPIYLDIEQIEDFQAEECARAILGSAAIRAEIEALRAAEFVEYERVARLKLRVLKVLFRRFLRRERERPAQRGRDFQSFVESEGELLHRFAVYCALDEAIHKRRPGVWNWRAWPPEYQDPHSPATNEFARAHPRSVLFHKYVQWQAEIQLQSAQAYALHRGLSIGLYNDLALATDNSGSDLWAHREFYVSGCRVGAPPDDFSPKGQDWAFPPPNAERHFEDGYRFFSESIRKNCRHGGALRIDHVMRFFRLFWIPDGSAAADGTYVRDRPEDLLRVLALESVRNRVIVVGEDLGTVPDEVREALQRFGALSYRLFFFERDPDGRFRKPGDYPRQALASTSTHDLATLSGFWLGRDVEARREAGLLPDEASYLSMLRDRAEQKQLILDVLFDLNLLPEGFPRAADDVAELTAGLHNAIVGFLASTAAELFLLNQEDLLNETEQQNLPGATAEYPNWRRKMRYTVEQLRLSPTAEGYAVMFRGWLRATKRLNRSAGEIT